MDLGSRYPRAQLIVLCVINRNIARGEKEMVQEKLLKLTGYYTFLCMSREHKRTHTIWYRYLINGSESTTNNGGAGLPVLTCMCCVDKVLGSS